MKRFIALFVGALMIVSAVLLRGWLDDGGPSSGDDDDDDDRAAVLACDPSLEQVCQQLADEVGGLEIVIEDAADTRARLEPGDARPDEVGIDGWLTLSPLPEIVFEQRDRAGLPAILGETSEPIARSPLVLVGWNDRMAAFEADCGAVDWKCIGDRAGATWESIGGQPGWGRVEPGTCSRTNRRRTPRCAPVPLGRRDGWLDCSAIHPSVIACSGARASGLAR